MSVAVLLTQQHRRQWGDGCPVGGRQRFFPAAWLGSAVLAMSKEARGEKRSSRRELWECRYSQDPTLAAEICPGIPQSAFLMLLGWLFFFSVCQAASGMPPSWFCSTRGCSGSHSSDCSKGRLLRSPAFLGWCLAVKPYHSEPLSPHRVASIHSSMGVLVLAHLKQLFVSNRKIVLQYDGFVLFCF